MKQRIIYWGLFMTLAGMTGCQMEEESMLTNPDQIDIEAKILHTKTDASEDGLLVKFASVPSKSKLAEMAVGNIVSFEKLFPSTPEKEDLEKEFGLDRWFIANLSENADIDATARTLASKKDISVVEFDIRMKRAADDIVFPFEGETVSTRASMSDLGFNDPLIVEQWNYYNLGDQSVATSAYAGGDINIKDTWRDLTAGDPSIIVAVVDQGVAYDHPDLAQAMWVNEAEKNGTEGKDDDGNGYVDDIYGYNFVDGEGRINHSDTDYDTGHGTHCAGIIGAINNNGIGMSGVAGGSGNGDGVKIMTLQVFSGGRGGESRWTSRAIKYAADNGASVVSCSYGYPGGTFMTDGAFTKADGAEASALRYFEASRNNNVVNGGVAVYASGNDGDPYAGYPGALNDVICVSAFGPDFLPTFYTNYGPGCNIVAPGGEAYLPPWTSYKGMILSTVPTKVAQSGYGYKQGTSMACPHVSGIAALGIAYGKKLGKKYELRDFKNMLVSSANDFDSRLNGTKTYHNNAESPLNLGKFMKKMGTGSIDTWIFMMKLEGVPCLMAETGKNQYIDVSDYFGTSSVNLTYLSVEMSEADKASLGINEEPYMQYGNLYIHPTRIGSGKIRITAVGGGDVVGGENSIGGMEITQEISIISRPFKSANGGWL